MRLRSYLALLALGAMVPLVIFGAIVGVFFVQHDRATFRRGVEARVLATVTAVDAEIGGSIATAVALGASVNVDAADFEAFRAVARRILSTQPHWSNINLAVPSGQQVVNLQRPPGSPLRQLQI